MVKASGKLIIILIVFIILAVLNIIIAVIIVHDIENDAELVNYTGIIRGGTQRICKLELIRQPDNLLLHDIEKKINQIINKKYHISFNPKDEKLFFDKEIMFKSNWDILKKSIFKFRENPDIENYKALIKNSELIWEESNRIVYLIENISIKKVKHFNYLILSIAFNFLLLLIEIIIINTLVKNKLEYSANYDFLTNIYNRSSFDSFLEKEISIAKRYDRTFFLIMFDIDHFKAINDNFGHDIGDYVLINLVKLINNNIRKTDYFCRIGGEEFMIIDLENDTEKANELAEKLKNSVAEYKFKKINKNITISIGLTKYKENDTKERLLKRVDKAMYTAKKNGRNRVEIII